MTSHDLPTIPGHARLNLPLGELLGRVDEPAARWNDLPARAGLYLIRWPPVSPLRLRSEAGAAGETLSQRWQALTRHRATDILYIGKGDSLRHRIRQLARFGRGHAVNHAGGKDLWWVAGIEQAEVVVLTCPEGCQTGFENAALERFFREHGDLPLANRRGPHGVERWWPGE